MSYVEESQVKTTSALVSNTSKRRIAIAGATGQVGSTLIQLLMSDPIEAIALTRTTDSNNFPSQVASVVIDFDDPSILEHALLGADKLFISHGSSPNQVKDEIAIIDAACVAGVQHVVKLSAMGPATRLKPLAWHMEIEAHLAEQPIASTSIRPTTYSDVLKFAGRQVAAESWTGAAGDGRVNFIDTRDVAAVARVALLEDVEPDFQKAYHVTGPHAWSMVGVAEELTRLLGHPVKYTNHSQKEQRATLLASGTTPFTADLLLGLDQMFAESVFAETTNTVQELTGQPPRSLTDWLKENIALFQK